MAAKEDAGPRAQLHSHRKPSRPAGATFSPCPLTPACALPASRKDVGPPFPRAHVLRSASAHARQGMWGQPGPAGRGGGGGALGLQASASGPRDERGGAREGEATGALPAAA